MAERIAPGLVRKPSVRAREAADAIHVELGIVRPDDIDLDLILAHHGLFARSVRLANEEGHLVRGADIGVVRVDPAIEEAGAGGFVRAHELGHFVMHPALDDFGRCAPLGRKRTRTGGESKRKSLHGTRALENEASDFSGQLLVPGWMLAPWSSERELTLDVTVDAAERFGVALEIAAIRVVVETSAACAAVYTVGGRVKWLARTAAFDVSIPWAAKVRDETSAALVHRGAASLTRRRSISRALWTRRDDQGGLVEQSIRLREDTVLTWLEASA